MITLFYSSSDFYSDEHVKNIGCKYEVIISNSCDNVRMIIERNDNIIVFINKKIIINEVKWGLRILDFFNRTNYDIIGLIGSIYLDASMCWCNLIDNVYGNFKQLKVDKFKYKNNFINHKECVVIDNGFICLNNIDKRVDLLDVRLNNFNALMLHFNINLFVNGYNIGIINSIDVEYQNYEYVKLMDEDRNIIIHDFIEYLPINLYDYKLYDIMIGNIVKELNK